MKKSLDFNAASDPIPFMIAGSVTGLWGVECRCGAGSRVIFEFPKEL
jgi:hypothetical protein